MPLFQPALITNHGQPLSRCHPLSQAILVPVVRPGVFISAGDCVSPCTRAGGSFCIRSCRSYFLRPGVAGLYWKSGRPLCSHFFAARCLLRFAAFGTHVQPVFADFSGPPLILLGAPFLPRFCVGCPVTSRATARPILTWPVALRQLGKALTLQ